MNHTTKLLLLTTALAACSSDDDKPKTDAEFAAEVATSMKTSITVDLANLVQAAKDLQTAAPTHAWGAADADAITAMKAAWRKTRIAYEHVEGATAPLFGDLDLSMDARLDDFVPAVTGADGDLDPFDDVGVTGMHAIERILYAPTVRPQVLTHEHTFAAQTPDPSYPTTDAQAMEFKTKLCGKLIVDATSLHDQWSPAAADEEAAFDGLVGLMNEQKEKVNLASTGEEESRYANMTLFDLRNNLDGTSTIYAIFQPWIKTKTGGADADAKIQAKFTALHTLYNASTDDALPDVPGDWVADEPTAANLATSFGKIWAEVHTDVDPNADGSVVFEMNKIAVLLGFKPFSEDM